MMEREVNQCAGGAGQFVGLEREEVAVRLDEEIDNPSFRCPAAAASQERQGQRQRSENQAPARKRSAKGVVEVHHLSELVIRTVTSRGRVVRTSIMIDLAPQD